MDREFEAILDECLSAVAEGVSLQECLARHPQYAQRLRPLLETAAQVHAVAAPQPEQAAQAEGRRRFLARAAQLRQAQQRRRPFLLRPLTMAAALALFLLAGSGFTATAATRSQPDSPLYPLKLRLEDARLWFAFGRGDRLDTRLGRMERRLEEVRWLLEHEKPVGANVLSELGQEGAAVAERLAAGPPPQAERARVLLDRQRDLLLAAGSRVPPDAQRHLAQAMAQGHNGLLRLEGRPGDAVPIAPEEFAGGVMRIEGLVEGRQGEVWRLGGASVAVGQLTLVEGDGGDPVGRRALATVARSADGSLRALRVVLLDPGPAPSLFSLRGVLDGVAAGRISIGGRPLPLAPQALRYGRPGRGQPVEVRGVAFEDGRSRVDAVRALPPGEEQRRLVYEGVIERVESRPGREYWQVSGQRFQVSGAFVDAHRQPYALGVRVRVEAEWRGGELAAQRVLVLSERGGEGVVKLEGVAQTGGAGLWAVAGIPVVSADAVPQPAPGTYVRVVGRIAPQGQVLAEEVVAFPPNFLRLEGVAQRLSEGQWLVAGTPVLVNQETRVVGEPAAGSQVVVWGDVGADGRWVARYIDVLDSATSR